MFPRHRTIGLIFKNEDREEADRLFKIFTFDFGKIEILGKGIRKISSKLKSAMQLFSLSEMEFVQGKIHRTLIDAVIVNPFKNLKKNLKKLAIAYKISEILERLITGEEMDRKIWSLLLETFQELDKEHLSSEIIELRYHYFFWNFISVLGFTPQLYFCAICQKKLAPGNIYFDEKEGGIICFSCFSKVKKGKKINESSVKILRLLLGKKFEVLTKIKMQRQLLNEINNLSENYLNFLIKEHAL